MEQRTDTRPNFTLPPGIVIPDGIPFASLLTTYDADGLAFFDGAVEEVLRANGVEPAEFFEAEDNRLLDLVFGWYQHAVDKGEPADPAMEAVLGRKEAQAISNTPLAPGFGTS